MTNNPVIPDNEVHAQLLDEPNIEGPRHIATNDAPWEAAHGLTHDAGDDDPSLWGWHHTFGKGARAGGWIVAVILLLMCIGNHEGHVEDLWMFVVAGIMIAALIYDMVRRRKAWRS